MANCGEMKKGDVFVCKNCGFELQVVKKYTCELGSGWKLGVGGCMLAADL
jgi:hypothetical protein